MSDLTKSQLRRTLRSARVAHPDRDAASNAILTVLNSQPSFQQAAVIAWYVDAGSEVITRHALRAALEESSVSDGATDRKIHAVPFCNGDDLEFYSLHCWEELEPGQFGILAPSLEVRNDMRRRVEAKQFDVVLVPAVGFDHRGNRLGQGKGFYDRFLSNAADAVKVGLAFDCQVVDTLPRDEHDVPVDMVISESDVRIMSR